MPVPVGNRTILAKHPDILERQADGLYQGQLGSPEPKAVLFDYLACQRVAEAYRSKPGDRDADLERVPEPPSGRTAAGTVVQVTGACRRSRSWQGDRPDGGERRHTGPGRGAQPAWASGARVPGQARSVSACTNAMTWTSTRTPALATFASSLGNTYPRTRSPLRPATRTLVPSYYLERCLGLYGGTL